MTKEWLLQLAETGIVLQPLRGHHFVVQRQGLEVELERTCGARETAQLSVRLFRDGA